MSTLEIITPSYLPDLASYNQLSRSLQVYAPDVPRIVYVRRDEVSTFNAVHGAVVRDTKQFLPRGYREIPIANWGISPRHPYPPLRGWIRQQIVKLGAAASSSAATVVLIDSDVLVCNYLSAELFIKDGKHRVYRDPSGVSPDMTRHMIWHEVALDLLGLPRAASDFRANFIAPLVSVKPALVRAMLRRVEEISQLPWAVAIGRRRHFSEFILYGIYVSNFVSETDVCFATDDLVHTYWRESPLDQKQAVDFAKGRKPSDLALMISAKSHTTPDVRRAVETEILGT